jgi:glycosyltransferase involved in cell wall biosynthesis
MSPPHVVHVIDELPPDGAERLIVDVLQHRSDRFRYSVLCIVKGGKLVEELQAIGIPVDVLGRKPGLDFGTLFVLARWFKAHEVRVVHTHLFSADTYGRLAAWLVGVPARFSTRHNTSAWNGTLRRSLARWLGRLSSRVIACGDEVGRILVDDEGLSRARVAVVPNGVNLCRLDGTDRAALRRELNLPRQCIVIGVLGRLHPQKGHLDLLEALQALRADDDDFCCVLAGAGELEPSIRDAIRERGLESHVRLLGLRKDAPQVLAGLDILAMPSRWEGLPMALLEGMALRNAVVATAVGSIPSVIDDGLNGLLVPAADPAAMKAALLRLIRDRALRERLGAAAQATVRSRFNAAHTAQAYERLYAAALDESALVGA